MAPSRSPLSYRTILRVVIVVGLSVAVAWLIYRLRQPLGWLFMAAFIAMAVSGPVARLERRMRRGWAIAIVYVGLLLTPVAIGALIVPTLVTQASELAEDVPRYAADLREFVQENERLRELDEEYNLAGQLEEQAAKLPARVGDAASTLGDLGLGLVNSLFALVNILILSIFMVAGGRDWVRRGIELRPEHERERWRRVLTRIGHAVGGYVRGALTIGLIAGFTTFLVLTILGVPFSAPLAVMAGLFSLIPLVGATIAAFIILLVTLFNDFPTASIAWLIWAVVYQQVENNVIQPQVQKRTVQVHPFLVLVAVLFGATLMGVIGALVAIPVAASLQIALRELNDFRQSQKLAQIAGPGVDLPPPESPAAPTTN